MHVTSLCTSNTDLSKPITQLPSSRILIISFRKLVLYAVTNSFLCLSHSALCFLTFLLSAPSTYFPLNCKLFDGKTHVLFTAPSKLPGKQHSSINIFIGVVTALSRKWTEMKYRGKGNKLSYYFSTFSFRPNSFLTS